MVMGPEFTLLNCYLNSLFMFKYKKFEATTTLPRTLGFFAIKLSYFQNAMFSANGWDASTI